MFALALLAASLGVPADSSAAKDPPPVEKPLEGKPVKILGRGFWRASAKPGAAPQQLVIRSEKEFAKLISAGNDSKTVLDQLKMNLKVDALDWDKQMLVVVTGGAQRSGGYRVEVTAAAINNDVLTVRWKLHSPKPTDIVTAAFTHPAETILIERFDGKVLFDPPQPAPKKPVDR